VVDSIKNITTYYENYNKMIIGNLTGNEYIYGAIYVDYFFIDKFGSWDPSYP